MIVVDQKNHEMVVYVEQVLVQDQKVELSHTASILHLFVYSELQNKLQQPLLLPMNQQTQAQG